MKTLFLILSAVMVFGSMASAQEVACQTSTTTGTTYQQAKYNCEVVIGGDASECQFYGSNHWGCRCTRCAEENPGHFTRTTGTSYDSARYNCEVVLNGSASNCQPSVNHLWYCDCNY